MKKSFLYAAVSAAGLLSFGFVNGQKHAPKSATKFIDKSNMDLSVKPGDNFYLYANGNWLKQNPVPGIKTRWGTFDVLRQTSSERIKSLAEEAAANPSKNSIAQRVGDFYSSAMDSAAIEKLGYEPIKAQLQEVAAITNKSDLLQEMISLRSKGISGGLFGFYVGQDDKDVNTYIPQLSQGGTALPDRDYYLKNNQRSKAIRQAYLSYMSDMFELTGI